MAKICTMFSGSSGNCTYISSGDDAVLVDAGVSSKQIITALNDRHFDLGKLKGIFITHSHSDHISGLRVLLGKLKLPVFASKETLGHLLLNGVINDNTPYYDIEDNPAFDSNMDVKFFRTSHDCEGSGGYVFTLPGGDRVAVCTDLGYVSDDIRQSLLGCKALVIESNHDVGMLQTGVYPFETKQRILSNEGHLSNVACATELPNLVKSGTTHIILAHLSKDNNTPDLAEVTAKSVLTENGLKSGLDYSLYIAPRYGGKTIYI